MRISDIPAVLPHGNLFQGTESRGRTASMVLWRCSCTLDVNSVVQVPWQEGKHIMTRLHGDFITALHGDIMTTHRGGTS